MDRPTSIINMWCNNSEVTVPAKLPKLYVVVIEKKEVIYLKQVK